MGAVSPTSKVRPLAAVAVSMASLSRSRAVDADILSSSSFALQQRAIANLRAFKPPPTTYFRCPVKRRAAVLILLYHDRPTGELRVVLTIRSAGLKNYAGHAALPGGKADTLAETPVITARREAWEEIGLPLHDNMLPPGYRVEHLTELPSVLAVTELAVRPCVAYLHSPAPSPRNLQPDVTRDILPKLNAKEVAALFTAPFRNFLFDHDLAPTSVPGPWYTGTTNPWYDGPSWRTHSFGVPVSPSTLFLARVPTSFTAPRPRRRHRLKKAATVLLGSHNPPSSSSTSSAKSAPTTTTAPPSGTIIQPGATSSSTSPTIPATPSTADEDDALARPRYRVFGMTARILVDCARVAYGLEPTFAHNSQFGDEDMLARLLAVGRLQPEKKEGDVLTLDIMRQALKAKL
ncbi:hypothetical protein MRB53_037749 [Persea americana]|nr:hypothetical protein MRB53_037749 [Persea americana]